MNDVDIKILKNKFDNLGGKDSIYWVDGNDKIHKVISIGNPPIEKDGDEPEPSECAYFRNGQYVALYNVELDDFFVRLKF